MGPIIPVFTLFIPPAFCSSDRVISRHPNYQVTDAFFCMIKSTSETLWTIQLPGVVSSPSDQMGPEDTLCSRWACDSAPCLRVGKLGSRDGKLPLRGSESSRSAPHCVPWSVRGLPNLALPMSKAAGWDYYSGTADRNPVCQDLCADVASPFPLLCHSQIPSG